MARHQQLQAGLRIGRYEIESLVHSCACNDVYRATDKGLARTVAIKITASLDGQEIVRFARSAQIAGMMKHRNIPLVFEISEHEGRGYVVMEFAQGEPLLGLIGKQAPIPYERKLQYAIQICDAVNFVHQQGAVHQQIGTGSVILMPDDSVRLLKFGAVTLSAAAPVGKGKVSCVVGFIPPEQLSGKRADARSDIWSLGCLLYELFTYHVPFNGRGTPAVILKILNEAPPPMKAYWNECPPELEGIVARCLEKDPQRRYASASAVAADLNRVLGAAALAQGV